ncbi:hypothetical protein ABIA33_001221 [Streptacidiphilus sp. MAP12-16]
MTGTTAEHESCAVCCCRGARRREITVEQFLRLCEAFFLSDNAGQQRADTPPSPPKGGTRNAALSVMIDLDLCLNVDKDSIDLWLSALSVPPRAGWG